MRPCASTSAAAKQLKDGIDGRRQPHARRKSSRTRSRRLSSTAEFDILYGEGISKEGSLLDNAVALDIIHKSGASFSYGDQPIGRGRENTRKYLKENPEIAAEIDKLVRAELMGKNAPAVTEENDEDNAPDEENMDDLPLLGGEDEE